jgi:hypothetical protein
MKYKQIDVSKKIIKLDPPSYPLLTLLKYPINGDINLKCKEVHNTTFGWAEQNMGENSEIIFKENSLQIFRNNFQTEYGEIRGQVIKDCNYAAIQHLISIEAALWMGEADRCKTCGKINKPKRMEVRHTDGIFSFLKDRIIKLKKHFSKKEFYQFLCEGLRMGSESKYLFVDKETFKYLNDKILENKKIIKKIGLNIISSYFNMPNCQNMTIYIIYEPFLKDYMCLLDLKNINYCYLSNRDTLLCKNYVFPRSKWKDNTTVKEGSSFKDNLENIEQAELMSTHYYLTECGLQLMLPGNHLIAKLN